MEHECGLSALPDLYPPSPALVVGFFLSRSSAARWSRHVSAGAAMDGRWLRGWYRRALLRTQRLHFELFGLDQQPCRARLASLHDLVRPKGLDSGTPKFGSRDSRRH